MSIGTKIDSLLEIIVNDVATLLESRFEQFRTVTDEMVPFTQIQPLLSICKGNSKQVVGAAAFSDLLSLIMSAILADDEIDVGELEVAKDVLSVCVYRNSWRNNQRYKQFIPLVSGPQVIDLLDTWVNDNDLLGGDMTNGAISDPLRNLVGVACLVTQNLAIHDQYTKIMVMAMRLVLESDGITPSEQECFVQKKKYYDGHREVLTLLLQPSDSNLDRSTSTELDLVNQVPEISPDQVLTDALAELKNLVGLAEVKTEISRLANFLKVRNQRKEAGLPVPSQSLHFVFTGNPGTGKTTVARIVSRLLYGFGLLKTPKLIETDRASLVGGYVGQTAIKTSDVVEKAINGVLFIDEAYTLSKKDSGADYGQEAIDTILKKMEDNRDNLVVIAAGYPDLMSQFLATNPGLESRFTRFVGFEDYHVADLCQIFERMCQANSYSLTQDARANLAILFNQAYTQREKNFGNARFVRNAYEQTLGNHADRLADLEGDFSKELLVTIEASDLPFNMVKGIPGPIEVTNSKWMAQCPGCKKTAEARIAFLGKRIRCKCGKEFIFPAWNLNPTSIPSLNGFEVFNRNQDLIGLHVPPKVASPVTTVNAKKPILVSSDETNSPRKELPLAAIPNDRTPLKPNNAEIAKGYLAEALEAFKYDDTDSLQRHQPRLALLFVTQRYSVLLDYSIMSVTTNPPPKFDPKIPVGQQTKPVSQMFEAVVSVTLCDRPNYPGTFAELLASRPKTYGEVWKFNCKEFTDGEWVFVDASWSR